jgi:antitoxin HicB
LTSLQESIKLFNMESYLMTSPEIQKEIERRMNMPYKYVFVPEFEGDVGFTVWVEEFPGCISQGDTLNEAWLMIRDAMEAWLECSLELGHIIPEPREL